MTVKKYVLPKQFVSLNPNKRTRWKRRVLVLLTTVFIIVCLLYVMRYPILRGMAAYLVYQDQPETCDVVIVLGGGGPIRAERAVALMQNGYAEKVLVTLPKEVGVGVIDGTLINMESLESQSVFYMNGIDDNQVHWSEEPFYSTYSEAQFIRHWLESRGYQKAIVVTGLFQSRRAKWTLDHFMEGSTIKVMVVPAEDKYVTPENWWTHIEGIVTVENEIIKNVYYTFKILFSDPQPVQNPQP